MDLEQMPKLIIGDLEVEKPIIQGGMGVGISLSGLASAVANEGGIGVISSVGMGLLRPDLKKSYREANKIALIEEIKKARKRTDGILGLNIMVAVSDYDDLVKIAFEEKIDVLFLGAGLPLKLPKSLTLNEVRQSKTKIAVIVSSARAAKLIFQFWKKNFDFIPDMVVVEGPMAGGHLGFKLEQINNSDFTLEKLVPQVISSIKPFESFYKKQVPVIAAGGIFTGGDILKFLELGSQGVQMATRFVATHECDASSAFKQVYLNCKIDDLMIIESPVGLPGRAIRNKFLDEVSTGARKPFGCPWKCLKTCNFREVPYCIADALTNARRGNLDEGYTFAGANAYRVNEIISVEELFDKLNKEYFDAILSRSLKIRIVQQV